MKVRDYECDLQGVVNNANYQHYMEHTRHEFLESLGVNFGKMHEDGLDASSPKYLSPIRRACAVATTTARHSAVLCVRPSSSSIRISCTSTGASLHAVRSSASSSTTGA